MKKLVFIILGMIAPLVTIGTINYYDTLVTLGTDGGVVYNYIPVGLVATNAITPYDDAVWHVIYNDWTDEIGTNDIQNSGADLTPRAGTTAAYALFNSSSDKATTGALAANELKPSVFTISCWVKMLNKTSAIGNLQGFVSVTDANDRNGWMCMYQETSDRPVFYIDESGNSDWKTIAGPSAFDTNTWYHLLATFDGTNSILYIDGSSVATTACDNVTYGTDRVYVGSYGDSVYHPLDGYISDIALWSNAVSPAGVTSIYNYGNTQH